MKKADRERAKAWRERYFDKYYPDYEEICVSKSGPDGSEVFICYDREAFDNHLAPEFSALRKEMADKLSEEITPLLMALRSKQCPACEWAIGSMADKIDEESCKECAADRKLLKEWGGR